MYEKLVYPSKGFLRNAKVAIRKGYDVQIIILPGWRKKILVEELAGLLTDEKGSEPKQSWKFLFRMLLVLPFFTAYLYAKSGNYIASYNDSDELVVSLNPPEIKNQ